MFFRRVGEELDATQGRLHTQLHPSVHQHVIHQPDLLEQKLELGALGCQYRERHLAPSVVSDKLTVPCFLLLFGCRNFVGLEEGHLVVLTGSVHSRRNVGLERAQSPFQRLLLHLVDLVEVHQPRRYVFEHLGLPARIVRREVSHQVAELGERFLRLQTHVENLVADHVLSLGHDFVLIDKRFGHVGVQQKHEVLVGVCQLIFGGLDLCVTHEPLPNVEVLPHRLPHEELDLLLDLTLALALLQPLVVRHEAFAALDFVHNAFGRYGDVFVAVTHVERY